MLLFIVNKLRPYIFATSLQVLEGDRIFDLQSGDKYMASIHQHYTLYCSNISMKVRQLTDLQTYRQFVIIGTWCENIPGKSP